MSTPTLELSPEWEKFHCRIEWMDVFICPWVQTKRACRLVFVFRVGKISVVEHQIGALRGRNPCSTPRSEIPQQRVLIPLG